MEITKINVLLVEDDKLSQRIATIIFTQLNCDVDLAVNGKIALEKLNNSYDIIFLDLGLADISGFVIAKKIRESQSNNQDIPVIALSAHDESSIKIQALESGMNDFLVKPLDAEKAKDILVKHVLSSRT